jgi:hypothetical protein
MTTTTTAFDRVVGLVEAATGYPGRNGSWRCPAHDDSSPSLSISQGDGKVVLHCHAGCAVNDIVAALGLHMRDLFDTPTEKKNGKARIVAEYDYVDAEGQLVFQVVRMDPKSFRQRRPDGKGGWVWKLLRDTPRPLYRLPQVLEAVAAGTTVFVCEGEKDVHSLERAGEVATTNPGGAGKWRPEHAMTLDGAAEVVVVSDADEPGRAHALAVADSLTGRVGKLLVVEPAHGKDVSEHLGAGRTVDELTVSYDSDDTPLSPSAASAIVQSPAVAAEPDILACFVSALHGCGVVGEDRNAQLVYLALTSRLLTDPVSLAVKGLSSSGKSHTVETTLKFFPRGAYIPMTAMSEHALVYMKEDFAHRTLVLFEAVALREQREKTESNLTAYFVRSLLSEGRISYPVTQRDRDGHFVTTTIVKNGPTNIVLTTTALSLHGENETRMLSLPTNDSAEQTRAVLRQLARPAEVVDLDEWQQLQEWLESAERRVVVPYALHLAENIPPVAVRLRRDFKSVLRLVESHAILHQQTRTRDTSGRIVADWSDYLAVRALIVDLLSDCVGATVPETVRQTVECVGALSQGQKDGVRANRVAEALKLDASAAYRRLQMTKQRGYIDNLEDRKGRPGRYVLGDPLPDKVELLPLAPPDDCTIAHTAGGERDAS